MYNTDLHQVQRGQGLRHKLGVIGQKREQPGTHLCHQHYNYGAVVVTVMKKFELNLFLQFRQIQVKYHLMRLIMKRFK